MSTIPKEIQDKIDEKYPLLKWMDNQMWNENQRQKTAAEYGYQLATGRVEELEKEFLKQKMGIEEFAKEQIAAKDAEIASLQSSLTEKEKECEELKRDFVYWKLEAIAKNNQLEELKAENTNLKLRLVGYDENPSGYHTDACPID